MKLLFALLLSTTTLFAQQQESILVQLQSDKVCINSDTCIVIKAHISLTNKHFYISDADGNKLQIDVRLLDRQQDGYFIYTTNDELSAYILLTHTKLTIDYSYDGHRFLMDYHIKTQNGNPLVQFY